MTGFDLELSQAGVELQNGRVREVTGWCRAVSAAGRTGRAAVESLQRSNAGLSKNEQLARDETLMAFRWGIAATAVNGVGAIVAALFGGLGGVSAIFHGVSQAYSTHAKFRSTVASLERTAQEWNSNSASPPQTPNG